MTAVVHRLRILCDGDSYLGDVSYDPADPLVLKFTLTEYAEWLVSVEAVRAALRDEATQFAAGSDILLSRRGAYLRCYLKGIAVGAGPSEAVVLLNADDVQAVVDLVPPQDDVPVDVDHLIAQLLEGTSP